MKGLVLAVLAACGSAVTHPSVEPIAVGDPTKLGDLIRGDVINGGLWFSDPACRTQFSIPGNVAADQSKDFARCLGTLKLQSSARKDALGDVVVLTYSPGFEIEARVVQESGGARLTWIGYEAIRDAKDTLPTITADALEGLRIAGDPNGAVEPALAAQLAAELPRQNGSPRSAMSWFKVCLDGIGNIATVDPRMTTSVAARDAFLVGINAWQFRPFVVDGRPLAVCAMARLVAPADAAAADRLPFPAPVSQSGGSPLVIAEGVLSRHQGERQIVPDDVTKMRIHEAGADSVVGSFRVCIDRTGHVESVLPLRSTGFPDYDRKIIIHMRDWAYKPYLDATGPIPVCTAVTFLYSQGPHPVRVER